MSDVERFESEMAKVKREGMDNLMNYLRKSDFYTAPASGGSHLACKGGLLLHSLLVLDVLRSILVKEEDGTWGYYAAGKKIDDMTDNNVIISALLHDLCQVNVYKEVSPGKYVEEDKMPLEHGAKSVMIVRNFIPLESKEIYSIWHHYGAFGNPKLFTQAVDKHPIVLAVHTADMLAAHFLEDKHGLRN